MNPNVGRNELTDENNGDDRTEDERIVNVTNVFVKKWE
jgi:hypothetical protein